MLTRRSKNIIAVLAILVALSLGIFAAVKINKIEKTKDLGLTSYSIGGISVTDGKDETSEYALRTDFLEAAKFNKITLAEKADVTYQVLYYDVEKNFLGKTEEQSGELTEIAETYADVKNSTTVNVKYFRVLVKIPENKDKVTLLNKNIYVKQITVTLDK